MFAFPAHATAVQHFELVKYSTIRKLKATQKCNEGVNRGTELKRGRKRSEHGLCSRLCKIPQLQILLCEKEALFTVFINHTKIFELSRQKL